MSLNRRHFILLASASLASISLPRAASAATLTLGPQTILPKSPGASVVSPNLAPLIGGKFRAAYSPQDTGAWALGMTLDYSGETGKPVGIRHSIGKGKFKQVSVTPVRLPSSRAAVYGENTNIYFQPLSSSGAAQGSRTLIASDLRIVLSLRAARLSNGNFVVAWVNRSFKIVGRILSSVGKPISKVLSLAPGVTVGFGGTATSPTALCALPGGGFAVAYNAATTAKFGVFNAKGVAGGVRTVDSRSRESITDVGLFVMPDGDVLALYRGAVPVSAGGDGSLYLRGRSFAPSGAATDFFQFPLNNAIASLSQEAPMMVRLKNGNFLVAAQIYSRSDSRRKIIAVPIAADGSDEGKSVTVFTSTLTSGLTLLAAQLTDMRLLTSGKVAIAWTNGDLLKGYKSYVRTVAVS